MAVIEHEIDRWAVSSRALAVLFDKWDPAGLFMFLTTFFTFQ
jgi:hypothetical protein